MRRVLTTVFVLGVLALAVWGAFALRIVDSRQVDTKITNIRQEVRHRTSRILPGGGGGTRASANTAACAQQCRANLRSIETAKRAIQARRPGATGSYSWNEITSHLGRRPACPCGGSYRIGTSEQLPTCSVGAGGGREAALQHVLRSF